MSTCEAPGPQLGTDWPGRLKKAQEAPTLFSALLYFHGRANGAWMEPRPPTQSHDSLTELALPWPEPGLEHSDLAPDGPRAMLGMI